MGMRNSGPGVERGAGVLAPAAAELQGEGAALGHEQVGDGDVLAAGGAHAHGVPGVDDLVVGLRHQAQPPVDGRLAVVAVDGDGQHVPVRVVDAGGERPAARYDEPAVGLARSAGGKGDGGGDQRVGVGVPYLALGFGCVVAEDPVVAGEVADVPGGGGAAAGELGRDVDDGDKVELHAAEAFGLVETEEARLVQQLLGVACQPARLLGRRCALAQQRHDLAGATHRLVVADAGEVAAHRLR